MGDPDGNVLVGSVWSCRRPARYWRSHPFKEGDCVWIMDTDGIRATVFNHRTGGAISVWIEDLVLDFNWISDAEEPDPA